MIPFKNTLPQDMSLLKRSSQGLLTLSVAYSRTSLILPSSFTPIITLRVACQTP
ncbi:hypothetical protein M405DRAFT_829609 [Rhizopogon salebrosus TDB-379]|nr:hypothetical protein M405DRAFT_829609 [Rhizopogon salebrosus TDB-379]